MSSDLLQSASNGLKVQLLDKEQAARSVVVSNISPQTEGGSIIIHFQRTRNGGGEIDKSYIPKKGTAVITFERSEVMETVLKRSHTIDGSSLKVHRLIPDNPPEVFGQVKARVNFDRLKLPPRESQKALKVLKDKTEVECRSVSNQECVIYGTFPQIEGAQKVLRSFYYQGSVPQQSKGEGETFNGDTTQTQQSSSTTLNADACDDEYSSLEVQPQFMKLLKRVEKSNLQDIEEKYGVEIVWTENEKHVQLRPSGISYNPQSYQKGCDVFIDLYQSCFPNMGREEIELKNADDSALEEIHSVEAEHDAVIEKVGNKLVVYAEKNKITSSVQALREKLGLQQGGKKTRRSQKSINFTPQRHNETSPEDRFSTFPSQLLKQQLSNGVNFSLYQGDLTDERVDAIVNAANEWLSHGGGVAAAIARKGGRQIDDDSRRIMSQRNRQPLDVGDAVYTRGGFLPCSFVIHTVGPRWSSYDKKKSISLLRRACLESLRLAAQLELCSIALPPISSGIFGMPKDICAQVMIRAIEDFSSSTEAEFSTLRDVRIVIIDDETIGFFREEFVKRYTSQETSPTTEPHGERSPSNEREVALKTAPELPSSSLPDNPPAGKPKSNEDGDVETPNEEVGSNVIMKSGNKPEEFFDSLKEVPPSNNNVPNTKKASPSTGIKTPDVEAEAKASGTNKEAGLEGPASAKGPELSNKNPAARPSTGRGRGVLAANLSGKKHKQPGSTSIEGTQLHENGDTRNADTGRGRGMTYVTTSTSPPGLTVTDEGRQLAQDHGKQVKDDQNKDPFVPMQENVEKDENGPSKEDVKEKNQEFNGNNQNTAGIKLNEECPQEHSKDENTSSHSQPSNGGITDSQDPKKNEASETDRESELLTSKDKQSEAKSEIETSMQVDQSRSDPTNDENIQEPLSSNPSGRIPETKEVKEVTSVTLHRNVDERDTLEERQTADHEMSSANSARDGGPLNTKQKNQDTSEPKCVMCMNLNRDSVFPLMCGHCFCKSCLKSFIEKTKICPKCKQENLVRGNQPLGYMSWRTEVHKSLPGYEEFETIAISFNFDKGIQGQEHPNPGQSYKGLFCTCYLPSSPAGQELCSLLRMAFDLGLIFTIGKCLTTGEENKIVWNGIELKTSRSGGPANYGYPDPSYLDRAKRQLAEKGILTQLLHEESSQ